MINLMLIKNRKRIRFSFLVLLSLATIASPLGWQPAYACIILPDGKSSCPDGIQPTTIKPTICNLQSARSTFQLNSQTYSLEGRQCRKYTLPTGSTFKTLPVTFRDPITRRSRVIVPAIERPLEQANYDILGGSPLQLQRRR